MKTLLLNLALPLNAVACLTGNLAAADTISIGETSYFGLVVEMHSDHFLFQPDCQGDVRRYSYTEGWLSVFSIDGSCAPPPPDEGRGDGPTPCEQVRAFPESAKNVFRVVSWAEDFRPGFSFDEPSSFIRYKVGEPMVRASPHIEETSSSALPFEVWVVSKDTYLHQCDLDEDWQKQQGLD